jgi:hypothetical protein
MPAPILETVLAAITAVPTGLSSRELIHPAASTAWRLSRIRVELSERMDRLQDGLDDLRQGYVVDWANVERTALIARGASDETRALSIQVTELTKLVRRLEAQIRDLRGAG